jgi:hypothetical protein
MLITFFDIKGTVHFEFTAQGETISQAYCLGILKRLLEAVRRKMRELWQNNRILHHDSAPVHKALPVKQFLAQKSITEMKHPPYSRYSAVSRNKVCLKGRSFQDTEDIQKM